MYTIGPINYSPPEKVCPRNGTGVLEGLTLRNRVPYSPIPAARAALVCSGAAGQTAAVPFYWGQTTHISSRDY